MTLRRGSALTGRYNAPEFLGFKPHLAYEEFGSERSGIGNFNHNAWVEDLSWKLSDETRQAPDLYP